MLAQMFLQQQAECEQHQAEEILLQTAPIMRQLLTLMQNSSLPKDWMTREPCCAQNCLPLLCEKRTDLVSEIHMELSPLAAAVRQHIHHCSVPVPCKSVQRHGTFGQRENPHSKKKRKLVDRSLQSQQARTEAFEKAVKPRLKQLRDLRITSTTRKGTKRIAPPCLKCVAIICAIGTVKLNRRAHKYKHNSLVGLLGLSTRRQQNRSDARKNVPMLA
jgi:hypothetical protein